MLHHSSLVAFVSVSEPERAKTFYRDILGLQLVKEDLPFVMMFDCNGSKLTLHIVGDKLAVVPYTVLGWDVDDLAGEIRELMGRGVTFERFPGLVQDELGIWTAPGGAAQVVWFKDPDGNLLSLSKSRV